MKKKLIAIVASLAMVATMVPATAFADNLAPSPATVELVPMTGSNLDDLGTAYNALSGNLDNVMFSNAGSTVIATGALPYRTLEEYSTTTKSLQTGNYIGVQLSNAQDGASGNAATKDLRNFVLKTAGTHTTPNGKVIKTTDLIKIAKTEPLVGRLEKSGIQTYDLYAVDDTDYAALKKHNWYGAITAADLPADSSSTHAAGKTSDLNGWLKDRDAITVTIDTTNLTLLNKADTEALEDFVAIVEEIKAGGATAKDMVDTAYKRHVKNAEQAYTALTDAQKSVIEKTVLQNGSANYKKAYNSLEIAKQNVEGSTLIAKVEEEIDALPTLPTTAFTDKAAIEAAYAPMAAAEADYAKLTTAQKEDVENASDLESYRNSYNRLIKAYVDPMYAQAAAIDLEQPLTAENIALITELKAYVDGKYIDTTEIDTFKQATYDALVAALDKVEKDGASLENATIAAIADQAYTGAAIEPAVAVTDQAGKEVSADDYTVIYSNNKDAGTATVTVAAKSSSAYTGSVSATFTITPAALTDAMVKSVANATYTGNAVTPAVTVDKGVTYDVTYKNNTAVGKATAVITGTGNYSGEITKNFIVKPAKEAISSLKAGKKSLTVAYKAQTGAKYRIVYSPAKGQAKAVNTTATKKTIKNLKAGKTYKVKVRAYKTIDGTTYSGTYSTVKKVKVK